MCDKNLCKSRPINRYQLLKLAYYHKVDACCLTTEFIAKCKLSGIAGLHIADNQIFLSTANVSHEIALVNLRVVHLHTVEDDDKRRMTVALSTPAE